MRIHVYILIILSLGCYKKNAEIEAIPIDNIMFKTTLKNHTPGIDYIINKSLEVKKQLIIEAGVEILVEQGCEIHIVEEGFIHSNGRPGQPVVFKNKDNTGRWKGIFIHSKGDNQLQHTEIRGAGSAGDNHAAVEVQPNGNLILSNCKIENNGDASALLITENAQCNIAEGCELFNNNFPIQMDLHAILTIGSGNHIRDNTNNAIKVRNQDGSTLVTKSDLNLQDYGLPYYITSWLIIDRKKLTVDEGVTLLFESNAGITTSGSIDMNTSLMVNGTVNNKVTIGSFRTGLNEEWQGILLSCGNNKIYHVAFNKCNSKFKNVAILNIMGYAYVDCKYCTFNAGNPFCNISLIGKNIVFNADIFTGNTFTNGLLPCLIL